MAAITGIKKNINQSTHVTITAEILKKESVILLEQIRTIDKSRLIKRIGSISKRKMREIDKALKVSCGIGFYGG